MREREVEIRKKEEEMVKRVKRMVELESKIREREIKIEKKEIEIEKKEVKEIEEREKKEKARLEEEKRKKEEVERIEKEREEREKEEEEVKISQVFDGTPSKVSRYVEDCRRYIERKMKGKEEEDKICWIVLYVQGDRTDKWKERIVDEMFEDRWKDRKVEDILKEIEREFGKGKKAEEDIERGIDGFWNVVKEKEVEVVKKKPKVETTMPRIPAVGRESGFWKR